jgi:hypothetical protein
MPSQKDFPIGSICEDITGKLLHIKAHLVSNQLQVIFDEDPKKKKHCIQSCLIKRVISYPLPSIGDTVLDEDGLQGVVISNEKSLTIKKKNLITSHSLDKNNPKLETISKAKNPRGGSRSGSGRPATGKKKTKVIRVDQSVLQRLPDLKLLADLLDDYRSLSSSINPAIEFNTKREFFKKLDAIPKIC